MYALVRTGPSRNTARFHVAKQVADAPSPRNNRFAREEENRLKGSVDLALSSLSASEKEAVITVLKEFRGDEGDIVTSKIAEKYHMTNSLVVNALRKLESAGIIRARSMGMRGTRILIINPFFRKEAEKLR